MSDTQYQLTVSAEQLAMISVATEIAARACIGQFDTIAFKLLMSLPIDQFCEVRDALDAVQEKVTGGPTLNAAPNEHIRDHHECAWSIYHAARYQLFQDSCAERGEDPRQPWTVLADLPHRHGAHNPPEVLRLPVGTAAPGSTIEDRARALLGPVLGECVRQRTEAGVQKYGQRLDDNHQADRAKAVHLVQEELDSTQYSLWLGDEEKARRHAAEAERTAARYALTVEEILTGGKQ